MQDLDQRRRATSRARAIRGLLGLIFTALAAGAGPALAQPPTAFVVEAPVAEAPAPEGVVKKRMLSWPPVLLSRKLYSEHAVRVSEDAVVPAGWTILGKPVDWQLKAGDLLTGGSHLPGIYCIATPKSAHSALCLRDSDGDGKFEESVAGLCDYGQGPYDVFIWTSPKELCSLKLTGRGLVHTAQPRPLTTPLAYVGADPREGPTAWANLILNETRRPKGDTPGRFFLQWAIGKEGSGNIALTAGLSDREYDLPPGGVGQVIADGFVLDFGGYTPDGGLRYRVTAQPGSNVVMLRRPIVRTITIVLP